MVVKPSSSGTQKRLGKKGAKRSFKSGKKRRSYKNYLLLPSVQLPIVYTIIANNLIYFISIFSFLLYTLIENNRDIKLLGVDFATLGFGLARQIFSAVWLPLLLFILLGITYTLVSFVVTHKVAGPLYKINWVFNKWVRGKNLTEMKIRPEDHSDYHHLALVIQHFFAPDIISPEKQSANELKIKQRSPDCFGPISLKFNLIFFLLGSFNIIQLMIYFNYYFDVFEVLQQHLVGAKVNHDIQTLFALEKDAILNNITTASLFFSVLVIILNFLVLRKLLAPSRLVHKIFLKNLRNESITDDLHILKNNKSEFYHHLADQISSLMNLKKDNMLEYLNYAHQQEMQRALAKHTSELRQVVRKKKNLDRFKKLLKSRWWDIK